MLTSISERVCLNFEQINISPRATPLRHILIDLTYTLLTYTLLTIKSPHTYFHVQYIPLPASLHIIYRGYYTVARRYEFYFRVAKQYFTNERSEWVKYCFCHEKIKFISSSRRVMFFLLYRHADDGVFDDFPKISDHLPKISEDFPKLFRRPDERFRTFSENFWRCPKIAEDFRGRPEDVSMIHLQI